MIRARFSLRAALDLEEITGHIIADNAEAAQRVRQAILNTADLARTASGMAARERGGLVRRVPAETTRSGKWMRAWMKIERGPAAVDFGGGQGGEACASLKRAARADPTPDNAKGRATGPL